MTHHYVSRSAVEQDWRCPRARYYLTVCEGRGIVPVEVDPVLHFGSVIHSQTQALTLDPSRVPDVKLLSKIANPAEVALAEGLLWGFKLIVLPRMLKKYEILYVEQELEYEIAPGITLLVQPDLLVRDLTEGTYGYIEYKTSKWSSMGTMMMFERQLQVHVGLAAARAQTGLPFDWAQIQVFHKSAPHKKTGRLMSPLVWAYTVPGKNIYSLEWKRDWEPFPTWTYDGPFGQGVEGWVRFLIATDAVRLDNGEDKLAACFPTTAPIFRDEQLIESARKQIAYREGDIAGFVQNPTASDLDRIFPQHFTSCQRGNYRCAFYEACHQFRGQAENIASSGLFVGRQPHHATEAFALDLDEEVY